MTDSLDVSIQEAYKEFCSRYPLKKLSMPKNDSVWSYYDINVKNENVIIFLHGICGTAGCFFYQMDYLSKLKCRILSLQYPCYSYIEDWIKNLCNLLEYLNIKEAHFFATDLGGYLIQLYAKLYPSKIKSLILCNSYRRTEDFATVASLRNIYGKVYSFLPHIILKNIMIEEYIYVNNRLNMDLKEKNALEFMSNELDVIPASDLGGRISLQLSSEIVDSIYVSDKVITLIQSPNNMLTDRMNEDMRKAYPRAKHALMKSGGHFPFLSRHEEVNLYILIHLRNNGHPDFVKGQIDIMSQISKKGERRNSHDNNVKKNAMYNEYRRSEQNASFENRKEWNERTGRKEGSGKNLRNERNEGNERNDRNERNERNEEKRSYINTHYNEDDVHRYMQQDENRSYTEKEYRMSNNYNYTNLQNGYENSSNIKYNEIVYRRKESSDKSITYNERDFNPNYTNRNYHTNISNANTKFAADASFNENINVNSSNPYNEQTSFVSNGSGAFSTEPINGMLRKNSQGNSYGNDDTEEEEYINVFRVNREKRNNAKKFNPNFNNTANKENEDYNNTTSQHHDHMCSNTNPNDMFY